MSFLFLLFPEATGETPLLEELIIGEADMLALLGWGIAPEVGVCTAGITGLNGAAVEDTTDAIEAPLLADTGVSGVTPLLGCTEFGVFEATSIGPL